MSTPQPSPDASSGSLTKDVVASRLSEADTDTDRAAYREEQKRKRIQRAEGMNCLFKKHASSKRIKNNALIDIHFIRRVIRDKASRELVETRALIRCNNIERTGRRLHCQWGLACDWGYILHKLLDLTTFRLYVEDLYPL